MSSIYKKGRDGYFYYQVYVFNKKTGKNDKKIYYSLGTKNLDEAKAKKIVIDNELIKKNKKNYYKLVFLILFLFITLFTLSYNKLFNDNYQMLEKVDEYEEEELIEKQLSKIELITIDSSLKSKNIDVDKSENNIDFTIIKTEKISGGFNQIKLFIIVPENSNSDLIRSTCEKIKHNYSDYKSIIICVFSDTKKDIQLAQGEDLNRNTHLFNKTWLAMYSYNPIEGHYFDNNPSGYLGVYK